MLGNAIRYALREWPVFPCYGVADGQCTCGNSECSSPWKHPCIRDWPNQATTEDNQVREWFMRRQHGNIATLTGRPSGILVIDVDPRNGGDASLQALNEEHNLPETLTSRTGGGGQHLIFAYNGEVRSRTGFRPGIDIKADGGYIILPPSRHISGAGYEWENLTDPAPLPASLLQILREPQPNRDPLAAGDPNWLDQDLQGVPEGQRNNTATRLAGHLIGRGMTDREVVSWLLPWNELNLPPLDVQEIHRLVASVRCTHERRNPSEVEQVGVVSFAEIREMPPDPTPPIINGILRRGGSLMITGAGALGKSTMLVNLALSLASASPFLGQYEIAEAHRVLILQAEDSFQTFQDRLGRMTLDWTGQRSEALRRIFCPLQGGSPQFFGSLSNRWGEPTGALQTVRNLIERTEADVLIIDPLISFHSAEENGNTPMQIVMNIFTGLAREYGLTIIVAHHHGQARQDAYYQVRGATSIVYWARAILSLTKGPAGGNGQRHLIKATWTKVNNFPKPQPASIDLELLQGATFRLIEQREAGIRGEDVATVLADMQVCSYEDLVAAVRQTLEVGENRAKAAVAEARREGLILRGRDPEDRRRTIYRLPIEHEDY